MGPGEVRPVLATVFDNLRFRSLRELSHSYFGSGVVILPSNRQSVARLFSKLERY